MGFCDVWGDSLGIFGNFNFFILCFYLIWKRVVRYGILFILIDDVYWYGKVCLFMMCDVRYGVWNFFMYRYFVGVVVCVVFCIVFCDNLFCIVFLIIVFLFVNIYIIEVDLDDVVCFCRI